MPSYAGHLGTFTVKGHTATVRILGMVGGAVENPQPFLSAAAAGYRSFMVDAYLSGGRLRRRSAKLVSSWQYRPLTKTSGSLGSSLVYSRIHDLGYDKMQRVRGPYGDYWRHMRMPERRYVRDTAQFGAQRAHKNMSVVLINMLRGRRA